ncbi:MULTISPECIES: GNAT family N-acetyltransferase [Oscillatoriales]|uniref:GCN5-related N-acetyltransferase n=1 Tax=Limnospira maxima CS-328 TaxID=513049 RepID=B5W9I9_LIMMA|nr:MULTISPECIES: GNAT family N-acetyltransferase [Oscillatoriales]EKD10413.1 GCN5-related N-acetyltransferase [Arthrospira platensis C1]MBD2711258.1 GNAT family N-acetyltransferase [Arthrospira platensis FACHB-835]MDC0836512.1 GNAT family N-acetyltransferase [Limnoraphis robusta]QJB28230.1 GNAT family N-acetyltransferase [Limnospira fusiformis SAG 85.79]EDZ91808.1 GCN5-related N-acetyltransferase [Limnospira maxima CS-328]
MSINFTQINSGNELKSAMAKGLYTTVHECFSAPPFNEKVTPEKVNFYFQKYIESGVLYLAYSDSNPMGFIAALPLAETANIGELEFFETWGYMNNQKVHLNSDLFTQQTGLSIDKLYYVADLGVAINYRQQGIATGLFKTLFGHLSDHIGYILRTTANPEYAYLPEFYQKLGFKMIPISQSVEYYHFKNELIQDSRLILVKLPND